MAEVPAAKHSHSAAEMANPLKASGWLERLWFTLLRTCAAVGFLFYCGWQVYWLGQARIPPSIFLALTGWPAPSTGGTRAILALLRGDWATSLRFNPLAVPMVLLLLLTFALLARQALHRTRLRLPPAMARAWAIVLVVAWIIQLSREALTRWFPS